MSADAVEAEPMDAGTDDGRTPGPGVQGQLFDVDLPAGAEPAAPAGWRELRTTAQQEEAIARRSEPLLLAAAAGSGKTTVLVERFVRAVLEDGIAPSAILALTFTDRAAGELRARVRERLAGLGRRAAARDTEAAFVGTFHGFSARLLRSYPLLAALPADFAILEEGVAGALADRAFTEAVREFEQLRGEAAVDLLAAYGFDQVRGMIRGIHAELRSRGLQNPALPPARARPDAADPVAEQEAVLACALLDDLLGLFGRDYEQLKRERGSADFDDLELGALALLRGSEPLRRSWSERFALLMVDEFQDTNPRQLAILAALDRDNLFTVGDEMQAIYGFRHANVELFRERRRHLEPRGASLELTANFRSVPALLEVVNHAFAARAERGGFTPLLAGRTGAEADAPAVELLLTDRCGWEEEAIAARLGEGLPRGSGWRIAEARLLAARIRELVDAGSIRAGEIVVLLRATGDMDLYERALQLAGLRTLAFVGGFWKRLEVRDLVARLRTIANPLDEAALYETLAAPPLSLSTDAMAVLAAAARQRGISVWEAASEASDPPLALGEEERARLDAFCSALHRERGEALALGISGLVEAALAGGYREHLLAAPDAPRRLANVHKLLRVARRYEESEGKDLRSFLDHAARLASDGSREPDAPVESADPDAVRLMTIHTAKGLEFPVVCVADLSRGANTRMPRLLVDGERIGLQLARLDGRKARPCLDYDELCEERSRAQAQEEDRIIYVAMTRAREKLILSGAVDVEAWPQESDRTAIGWISQHLAGTLETLPRASGALEVELGAGGAARVRVAISRPDAIAQLCGPAPAGAPPGAPLADAPPAPPRAGTAAGEREEPGALVGLVSISYTALAALERCGYRFYLERVLGLPEERPGPREAPKGLAADLRGTIVHELLEGVDFAAPRTPSLEDVRLAARRAGARPSAAECEEIAGLVEHALAAPPARRIAACEEPRREHPFAFAITAERPLVTGVIDLLAREPDGSALVVDYKTDRLSEGDDLAARADADYAIQRLIYAVAVLREGAPAVEVVHWFLERPAEPAAVRFGAEQLPALERELEARLRAADEGGFAVSEHPHRALCLTCPGRGGLCSWSEHEQMRESP